MSGFNNPIIGGGGSLVYPAIKSPNFRLSPFTGWKVDKAGNAWFAAVNIGNSTVVGLLQPSGDHTGTLDSANIAAALSLNSVVGLAPGTWYVKAGQVILTPGQYLFGSGYDRTIINGIGTGIVLQQTNTGAYSSLQIGGSIGGPDGLTVDITGMGAGSAGVQVGNFAGGHINAEVQDTGGTTPAAKGIYLLNDVHFTEQLHIQRGWAHGCTIVFDVADGPGGVKTGTNSFKGLRADLYVNEVGISANDGLVLQNGANIYDAMIKYTGNFAGTASGGGGAAIRLIGTVPAGHPGAGGGSRIQDSILEFGPECSAGSFTPQSIFFQSASNVIADCAGVMDFGGAGSNFTPSNWPGSGSFLGPISGDANLAGLARLAHPLTLDQGINLGHGQAAQALANGSTITTGLTYAPCSLTAAVTGIIMQAGTFDGQAVFVANEAGAASGFTLAFAAAGSNVRNPVTINPGRGCLFVWNTHVSQWIQATP